MRLYKKLVLETTSSQVYPSTGVDFGFTGAVLGDDLLGERVQIFLEGVLLGSSNGTVGISTPAISEITLISPSAKLLASGLYNIDTAALVNPTITDQALRTALHTFDSYPDEEIRYAVTTVQDSVRVSSNPICLGHFSNLESTDTISYRISFVDERNQNSINVKDMVWCTLVFGVYILRREH